MAEQIFLTGELRGNSLVLSNKTLKSLVGQVLAKSKACFYSSRIFMALPNSYLMSSANQIPLSLYSQIGNSYKQIESPAPTNSPSFAAILV